MSEERTTLCPNCQKHHYLNYGETRGDDDPPFPALSRKDNKTYVCDQCGLDEAMLDWVRGLAEEKLKTPE